MLDKFYTDFITELTGWLNQIDLYRLSCVSHILYQNTKGKLKEIQEWMQQRCNTVAINTGFLMVNDNHIFLNPDYETKYEIFHKQINTLIPIDTGPNSEYKVFIYYTNLLSSLMQIIHDYKIPQEKIIRVFPCYQLLLINDSLDFIDRYANPYHKSITLDQFPLKYLSSAYEDNQGYGMVPSRYIKGTECEIFYPVLGAHLLYSLDKSLKPAYPEYIRYSYNKNNNFLLNV